ncbi:hypothetical protein WG219_11410 [Ectopseudomonas mendocina]|uniref:Uncharacterized protein n=1 Tax=Ectopseudomonas mendocina TaxID=300 RepID=A0ABZ2RBH4_ECTME
MTEREMLELAAKAASIKIKFFNSDGDAVVQCGGGGPESCIVNAWNPAQYKSDALALAATLKFTVDFERGVVWGAGDLDMTKLGTASPDDPYMCLAITSAAAEIGKNMP